MIYTKTEIINKLEQSKLIFPVGKKYVISKKLSNIVLENEISGRAKNLPDSIKNLSADAAYRMVMDMAEIPMFGIIGFSKFSLRTKDAESVIVLQSIMDNPDIDFKRFIESVKSVYKDKDLTISGFARYLKDGTWEDFYVNYDKPAGDDQYNSKGVI